MNLKLQLKILSFCSSVCGEVGLTTLGLAYVCYPEV